MWGDDIRAARIQAGLSQSELARRARVSRKQLTLIEKNENTGIETIAKVVAQLPDLATLSIGPRRIAADAGVRTVDLAQAQRLVDRAATDTAAASALLGGGRAAKVLAAGGRLVHFPETPARHISITLAEEQQMDALRQAIADAPRSMVQWRAARRADPAKYVVRRGGRAAAGHGAIAAETPDEKRRQIPEHYWEERGARETIVLSGDSLADLGYVDHDLLFVRPIDGNPKNNDVIVCRRGVPGSFEVLVKVFAVHQGHRWLLSANEREAKRYPPIPIDDDPTFGVLGVVVGRSGYALPGSLAPRPPKRK